MLTVRDVQGPFGAPGFSIDNFEALAIDAISLGSADAVIPEPATWALMIAGFGLVGAAARRRRVSLAASAALPRMTRGRGGNAPAFAFGPGVKPSRRSLHRAFLP